MFVFLKEDKNWNHLIQDAQKRGAIIRTTEKNYKKEALRILKLRPTGQSPAKGGTMTSPVVQAGSSSGKKSEPGNSGNSPRELAAGSGHAVPQGSRGATQPAGTPAADSNRNSAAASMGAPAADSRRGSASAPSGAAAVDSRRGSAPPSMGAPATDSRRGSAPASMGVPAADSRRSSAPAPPGAATADSRRGSVPAPSGAPAADSRRSNAPAPSGAAALAAIPEKPRDPRLASLASRTEAKGREQPLKDGHRSAQSNPASTPQQGLAVSSAARDQVCRTENAKKAQQTAGQCNVLPTAPPTAQHEGERRAAVSRSGSKAPSEGGQSSSSEWNKDSHGLSKRPSQEGPGNTDSGSTKRRKFFP